MSKNDNYVKIPSGDIMINQGNVEKLFDLLDESASILFETLNTPYLEGLVKTCENILANSVDSGDQELDKRLLALINEVTDIDFNREEIRKAFQYACLKGYKHQNFANDMITPESIGIFFSYLVEKLYNLNDMLILDPLVGTGNLVTSVANNLNKNIEIIGIDINSAICNLAQALFGMLEYGDNVYCQDVNTFKNISADLIVTDFSGVNNVEIFSIIKHANSLLKKDSFLISVIDNVFFADNRLKDFIFEVKDHWHFFGMIVLPKSLFKNNEKSIFIMQSVGENFVRPEKFLVAELPDLSSERDMIKVISQLNDWFKKIDFYRVRKNNE